MRPVSSRGSRGFLPSAGASSATTQLSSFSITSEGSSSGRSQSHRSSNMMGGGGRSIMTAGGGGTQRSSTFLPVSEVDVSSNRPVTGKGGLARVDRRQNNGLGSTPTTRIVESSGYYSNLLQSKMEAIVNEICRLRMETELADGDSEARRKVENDFEDALKDVHKLEGELADYNMAREKSRSGASHQDIHDTAIDIINRNTKLESEVDGIFLSRKKVEGEIAKLENELKKVHVSLEKKFLQGGDDDPEKLSKYQRLVQEIEGVHEESKLQEDNMALLRNRIKIMESNFAGHSGSGFVNRYKEGEKRVKELRRQIAQTEEDIQLARMEDESEAREKLLEKVKSTQQQAKEFEMQSALMKSEIEALFKEQMELRSELRMRSRASKNSEGGTSFYEHMIKKEEDMNTFLEDLPGMKSRISGEQSRIKSTIQALLEDISKGISLSEMKMPSKGELEVLKDEVTFTSKNLDASQETIKRLQQQKKTRMEELERINTLGEKIRAELKELDVRQDTMNKEIAKYKNLRDLQESADATRDYLVDMSEKYAQRIQYVDDLLKEISSQYEQNVKTLESNETWRDLEDMKSKLRDQGETVFELQEEVNMMKVKTDYGGVKVDCLQLVESINSIIVGKKSL